MKKLLIALILLFSVQLGAQTKDVADAVKAFEKAKSDSQNPKRAENPLTWTRLASAYATVYDAPIKALFLNAARMEIKLLLKDQRIVSTEEVVIAGVNYTVDVFTDKRLYYAENGELVAWEITNKYVNEDLLNESLKALDKAIELDPKGSRTKEITDQLNSLKNRFFNEAMSSYALGNFKESSVSFEKAAEIGAHKFVNMIDTAFIYYAGLTAYMGQDKERAIKFFTKSMDYGYDANGDVFSYLAEAYKSKDDIEMAKEILNNGFRKYPSTQSILVSLINTYIESNDDPAKILELIHQAQKNEPENATLYYAEGNVWKNLNDIEKAVECYQKSVETDKNYYFGYFAIGAAFYDKAVDIQAKAADEMDDAKYEELVKQLEHNLESAIDPFEKCFAASPDEEIKAVVAEYLKNIYFRFREKSPEFMAGYEKYNALSRKE
jgi:tetratricopeptide (TPR) repeat protein